MKIVALAGGVGGSKLAYGLSKVLRQDELTIVVNTGDDFDHLGLKICPDLDTVMYALAEKNNPSTGWGRDEETWNVRAELLKLGEPSWFNLGDKDLAVHLLRSELLKRGMSLTETTSILCKSLGVLHPVLPMTDSPITTRVITIDSQNLAFQEYYVREKCQPIIKSIRFKGISEAVLSKRIIEEIEACDFIVICPSNPFVSIDPILNIPGMKEILLTKIILAISPLVARKAIKGPLEKMCLELGLSSNSVTIAKHYQDLIKGFVIDHLDAADADNIARFGIIPKVTNIIMINSATKIALAEEVILFGRELIKE